MEELGIPLVLAAPKNIPMASLAIYQYTTIWPPNYGAASALALIVLSISSTIYIILETFIRKRQWTTVNLRGFRKERIRLSKKVRYLLGIIIVLYLFLVDAIPIFSMILKALSSTYYVPRSFSEITLDNFSKIFSETLTQNAMINSLTISLIGALILLFLVFISSIISYRTTYKGGIIMNILATIPLATPSVVMALGIYFYFVRVLPTFIYASIWAIMFALISRFVGHGFRVISPGIMQIHQGLEDAARMSGASWITAVKDIILKLTKPALISTYFFLLIYFLRELPVSILLYTSTLWYFSLKMKE